MGLNKKVHLYEGLGVLKRNRIGFRKHTYLNIVRRPWILSCHGRGVSYVYMRPERIWYNATRWWREFDMREVI